MGLIDSNKFDDIERKKGDLFSGSSLSSPLFKTKDEALSQVQGSDQQLDVGRPTQAPKPVAERPKPALIAASSTPSSPSNGERYYSAAFGFSGSAPQPAKTQSGERTYSAAFGYSDQQAAPAPVEPAPAKKEEDSGDFFRGAGTALQQTPALLKGAAGLVGATAEKTFGEGGMSTALKDWGYNGFKEGMAKAEEGSKDTDSATVAWDRAKKGDLGALVDWAQYGLGYTAGNVAETLATAVLGSVAGGAVANAPGAVAGAATGVVGKQAVKGFVRNIIETAVEKEAAKLAERSGTKLGVDQFMGQATKNVAKNIGETGALFASNFAKETGGIYGDAVDEAKKNGQELSGGDLARIWTTGTLAALTETAVDKLGLDAAAGKFKLPGGGRFGRAIVGATVGGATEGGTEVVQTALERLGAGKDLLSSDAVREYIDSGALGALGGGSVGAVTGAVRGDEKEEATTPPDVAKTQQAPGVTSTEETTPNTGNQLTISPDALRQRMTDPKFVNYVAAVYEQADEETKVKLDAFLARTSSLEDFQDAQQNPNRLEDGRALFAKGNTGEAFNPNENFLESVDNLLAAPNPKVYKKPPAGAPVTLEDLERQDREGRADAILSQGANVGQSNDDRLKDFKSLAFDLQNVPPGEARIRAMNAVNQMVNVGFDRGEAMEVFGRFIPTSQNAPGSTQKGRVTPTPSVNTQTQQSASSEAEQPNGIEGLLNSRNINFQYGKPPEDYEPKGKNQYGTSSFARPLQQGEDYTQRAFTHPKLPGIWFDNESDLVKSLKALKDSQYKFDDESGSTRLRRADQGIPSLKMSTEEINAKFDEAKGVLGDTLRRFGPLNTGRFNVAPEEQASGAELFNALAGYMYWLVRKGVRSFTEAVARTKAEFGDAIKDVDQKQLKKAFDEAVGYEGRVRDLADIRPTNLSINSNAERGTNPQRDRQQFEEVFALTDLGRKRVEEKKAKKGFLGAVEVPVNKYPGARKGSPMGDSKDIEMRKGALGAIVELANDKPSSSRTTLNELGRVDEDSSIVVLARNSEFAGKPLSEETKRQIDDVAAPVDEEGNPYPGYNFKEFRVGDMPGVDSEFVKYLLEKGYPFRVFYTSDTGNRIASILPKQEEVNAQKSASRERYAEAKSKMLANPNKQTGAAFIEAFKDLVFKEAFDRVRKDMPSSKDAYDKLAADVVDEVLTKELEALPERYQKLFDQPGPDGTPKINSMGSELLDQVIRSLDQSVNVENSKQFKRQMNAQADFDKATDTGQSNNKDKESKIERVPSVIQKSERPTKEKWALIKAIGDAYGQKIFNDFVRNSGVLNSPEGASALKALVSEVVPKVTDIKKDVQSGSSVKLDKSITYDYDYIARNPELIQNAVIEHIKQLIAADRPKRKAETLRKARASIARAIDKGRMKKRGKKGIIEDVLNGWPRFINEEGKVINAEEGIEYPYTTSAEELGKIFDEVLASRKENAEPKPTPVESSIADLNLNDDQKKTYFKLDAAVKRLMAGAASKERKKHVEAVNRMRDEIDVLEDAREYLRRNDDLTAAQAIEKLIQLNEGRIKRGGKNLDQAKKRIEILNELQDSLKEDTPLVATNIRPSQMANRDLLGDVISQGNKRVKSMQSRTTEGTIEMFLQTYSQIAGKLFRMKSEASNSSEISDLGNKAARLRAKLAEAGFIKRDYSNLDEVSRLTGMLYETTDADVIKDLEGRIKKLLEETGKEIKTESNIDTDAVKKQIVDIEAKIEIAKAKSLPAKAIERLFAGAESNINWASKFRNMDVVDYEMFVDAQARMPTGRGEEFIEGEVPTTPEQDAESLEAAQEDPKIGGISAAISFITDMVKQGITDAGRFNSFVKRGYEEELFDHQDVVEAFRFLGQDPPADLITKAAPVKKEPTERDAKAEATRNRIIGNSIIAGRLNQLGHLPKSVADKYKIAAYAASEVERQAIEENAVALNEAIAKLKRDLRATKNKGVSPEAMSARLNLAKDKPEQAKKDKPEAEDNRLKAEEGKKLLAELGKKLGGDVIHIEDDRSRMGAGIDWGRLTPSIVTVARNGQYEEVSIDLDVDDQRNMQVALRPEVSFANDVPASVEQTEIDQIESLLDDFVKKVEIEDQLRSEALDDLMARLKQEAFDQIEGVQRVREREFEQMLTANQFDVMNYSGTETFYEDRAEQQRGAEDEDIGNAILSGDEQQFQEESDAAEGEEEDQVDGSENTDTRQKRGQFSGVVTAAHVQRIVELIKAKAGFFPEVTVLGNIYQLPQDVLDRVLEQHGDNVAAKGLFDAKTGRVYVFSDFVSGETDIEFTLFHEIYGHYGIRGILGDKLNQVLTQMYNTIPQLRKMTDELMKKERIGKLEAVEEALSDLAGMGKPGPLQRFLGKVVELLKPFMPGVSNWLQSKIDVRAVPEVAFLLKEAKEYGRNGGSPVMNGAPSDIRLNEAPPPYEIYAMRGKTMTGYARYNPVMGDWYVFTNQGQPVTRQYSTVIVRDINEVQRMLQGTGGRLEMRTRSPYFIDNSTPDQLASFEDYKDPQSLPFLKRMARNLRLKVQNEFLPVLERVKYLEQKYGKLDDFANPYKALLLYEGRAVALLEDFNRAYVDRINLLLEKLGAEGADKMLKIGDYERSIHDWFLIARHAPERNKHIRKLTKNSNEHGSGIPDEGIITNAQGKQVYGAKETLEEIRKAVTPEAYQTLETMGRLLDRMSRNKVRIMYNKGLISGDSAKALMVAYKHYVPMKDAEVDTSQLPNGRKINLRGQDARRSAGRGLGDIPGNTLENALLDFESVLIRGEKNVVANTILAMMESFPDPNVAVVNVLKYRKKVQRDGTYREVPLFTDDGAVDMGNVFGVKMVPNYEVVTERDTNYINNPNVLVAKVGGRPVTIEFKEGGPGTFLESVHGSMVYTDPVGLNAAAEVFGKYNRFIGQMITTWNPVWVFINGMRDIQTAMFNAAADDRLTKEQVVQMGKAMPKALKAAMAMYMKDTKGWGWLHSNLNLEANKEMMGYLEEMRKAGGLTLFMNRNDMESMAKNLRVALEGPSDTIEKLEVKGKALIKFLEGATTPMEVMPRLAAYATLRKSGWSETDAAIFAKELTVNFNMRGQSAVLRNLYLFFNPAVQGSAKIVELAAKNPKQFAKIAVPWVVVGAMMNAIARSFGDDDDDDDPRNKLDKIPNYKRATSMVIAPDVPFGAIPLAYGWNAFYSMGHFVYDSIIGVQPLSRSLGRATSATVEAFLPQSSGLERSTTLKVAASVVTPTALAPLVDIIQNENRYGAPIYQQKNGLVNYTQANAYMHFDGVNPITRNAARFMNSITGGSRYESGLVDFNPGVIEYLITSMAPGLVAEAYKTSGTLARVARGEELARTPKPVVDRFTASAPAGVDIRAFENVALDVNNAYKTVTDPATSPELRAKVLEEHPNLGAMHGVVSSTTYRLRQLNSTLRMIEESPNLPDPVKVAKRNQIKEQQSRIFGQFVRAAMRAGYDKEVLGD